MLHFEPKELTVQEVHKLLLGGVAPRPIALVSTMSEDGIVNLSPFSFFNAFGANPPIIAFSPSRKGRDATLKDTYKNISATGQCVVNVVTYPMVEQVSLASAEFPSDINEFEKAGLTPVKSDIVKPHRVKESPFQMECILRDLMSYGKGGTSANIAICEVVKFHYDESIMENGIIMPDKIDLVARMSSNFYSRASGKSIFSVEKPINKTPVGIDSLPKYILNSELYTGNDLGRIANIEYLPSLAEAEEFIVRFNSENPGIEAAGEEFFDDFNNVNDYKKMLKTALNISSGSSLKTRSFFERTVKCALKNGDLNFAVNVAVYAGKYL